MKRRFASTVLLVAILSGSARADALAKLTPEKLEAVHKAIQALKADWQAVPRTGAYREYRANLHVHSSLSHDSRGTIGEIVAAAKATGTRVLMFTEHPSERHDYYTDGHRGIKDGVLLIPGAETNGFLAYPTRSLRGLPAGSPQEFADLVRSRGGLVFLCHLEERMDWEIRGLTGSEIYNTHADFKDEKKLIAAMRNPLWLLKSAEMFRKYPQEAFSALQDYPADYLRRWDQLCAKSRHTGVAGNDSHQNVGLIARLSDEGRVRFEDPLGKKLYEMKAGAVVALLPAPKNAKAGDELFRIQLDPYENSLRHVGTHLLLTELSEKAIWEALAEGRAFVAFDWLADSSGFDFIVCAGDRHEMGSRLRYEKGLHFQALSPLPVHWKLIRDGKINSESDGRSLDLPVEEPGNYRVEAWLKVAGEDMIWILSNPIYVRPAAKK
jgi:PHP domain